MLGGKSRNLQDQITSEFYQYPEPQALLFARIPGGFNNIYNRKRIGIVVFNPG
jgi:hypothetical protein